MKNPPQILPAVAAILFNELGEVLLQKRRDVNQWCIIAGHVEFGETVEEAILREIFEETNARARIIRFIGLYSSPESQTYHYPGRTVQYVTSYFEAQFVSPPDLRFTNQETGELRFFRPDNLPDNLALINAHWLSDALQREGRVFIR